MLADPLLWLAVFSASAPDLDFLPGLLLGNESLFHRAQGHSLGGAMVYGLLVLLSARLLTGSWRKARHPALLAAGLFLSHLLLDLAVHDPGPPYGIQFLWPLSEGYTFWEWTFIPNLDRHPFDRSVIARALPVVAVETLVFFPLLLAAGTVRRRRGSGAGPSP
jgi:membrane-bound metal-dependent hydrolase YbcI (DUF457 family)